MKICVIHRYPISVIRETNPSFPLFMKKLFSGGHKVFFISYRERAGKLRNKNILYREIGFTIDRSRTSDKLLKSLLFTLLVPFKVRKLHRKEYLDLVYCDDSFPFYSYLIKVIAKTKTIIRLGDLQTAYMFADRGRVGKLLFKILFACERHMWRKTDKVIAISRAFKHFLINNGIREDKIGIVQECIDLEMFKPKSSTPELREKYQINHNDTLIMFHGLITRCKGIDTLLRAVPLVLKQIPAAKFMIIGDGPELKKLRKLSRKLEIESSVIFTGWVPFQKIPKYLNEADIGIPMRSGNLGNNFVVTTALLQYWALRKPVITPRLAAMANIIQEGKNGLLFEPNNAQDLADKIIFLHQNPRQAQVMGGAGYKVAQENFSTELVAQKMKEIISEEK